MSNIVVNTMEYNAKIGHYSSTNVYCLYGFENFEAFMNWALLKTLSIPYNVNEKVRTMLHISNAAAEPALYSNWYGNLDYNKLMSNTLRDYQDLQRLNTTIDKFTQSIDTSLFSMIKKRKLRFNDRFGNFSFDRASAGLFILDEYYSPSQNAIVDERNVTKKNNAYFLKSDNSIVEKRKQQREDGSPYYKTSVRSVFGYFPEEPQQSRAVEIFSILAHDSSKTADQILWSGIAAITVASILEQANIPTKISGLVYADETGDLDEVYISIIPVKQFHETLDISQIAFALSDPAFFRTYGFFSTINTFDIFNKETPDALGYPVEKHHQKLLQPYIDEKLEQGIVPLFFPQVYSERECENYITYTIRNLATLFNGSTP